MWLSWDTAIFRAIHFGLHHPWLDPIMRALTNPGPFKIPLLVLLGAVFLTRGRRGWIGVVVLALTIASGDQLSSKILKPIFKRARPSVVIKDSHPLFGVRHSSAFPSAHATNSFAAAPVIAYVLPEVGIAAYVVAGAISFSRIYVGDHWPSDVLAGTILGLFLGFLGRRALRRLERTLPYPRRRAEESPSGVPLPPHHAGGNKRGRRGTRYTRARS